MPSKLTFVIPALYSRKALVFGLLILAGGVAIYVWYVVHDNQAKAERDALLAQFEVISDPFARPKIYRHKSASDLNPAFGRKELHGEISLITTSEGKIAFLILLNRAQPEIKGSALGIMILAQDEVFSLHLSPSRFSPDDKFKYRYPPDIAAALLNRDDRTLKNLTDTLSADLGESPYLCRVMDREDEQAISGDQLKAFKETFRLAKLLQE